MSICSQCGAELVVGGPAGACTRCLILMGLNPQSGPDSMEGRTIPTDGNSDPGDRHPEVPTVGSWPRMGDYELLEEIARGGMGVVYLARQSGLGRKVAVKTILHGSAPPGALARRFLSEAGDVASLRHPNIVTVHSIGEHNGQLYFSMDYLPGGSLAKLVREGPLGPRRAAGLVKILAGAVHYAHERNILHRDLKPSNVLLDEAGQPVITDFGLARRLDRESSITQPGQLVGSPSYMPPEQAGGLGRVGRPSDVYGLGGILYFLLTGRAAFVADSIPQVLEQVLRTDPLSPRLLNPGIPQDLATICLKCLEKEPEKRYPSAADLAADLGRFLDGEPIEARPVGRVERAWRWSRRRPALAGALAATGSLFLLVAIGSPIAALRIQRERDRAELALVRLRENLYSRDIRLASQAITAHNFPHALKLLRGIDSDPDRRSLRGWEWWHLWDRCQGPAFAVLQGHASEIAAVRFSPDDRLLGSIDEQGVVRIWDWTHRNTLDTWVAHPPSKDSLRHPWARQHGLAFLPDGRRLVTGGIDGQVRIWLLEGGGHSLAATLPGGEGPAVALDVSPDGLQLAVGIFSSGRIHLWSLSRSEPQLLKEWQGGTQWITDLRFLPDPRMLAVAGSRSLAVWNLSNITNPIPVARNLGGADILATSASHQWLMANASDAPHLRAWHLPDLSLVRELPPGTMSASAVAISSDGGLLASAGTDDAITLVEIPDGSPRSVFDGHEGPLKSLAFTHHGRILASAGADTSIRLWEADSKPPLPRILRHGSKVESIRFLPDSSRFLTLGRDRAMASEGSGTSPRATVKLWDLASQQVLVAATNQFAPLHNQISLAPGAQRIAVRDGGSSQSPIIRLLDLPSLNETDRIPGNAGEFIGNSEALIHAEGSRLMHREKPGDAPVELGRSRDTIKVLAVSPDGKSAASRSGEGTGQIEFWDLRKAGPPVTRSGHDGDIVGLSFSPDGLHVASAAWDRTVGLWSTATRSLERRLAGHRGDVNCVAFSSDGRTLASGSDDGWVILWNVRSGDLLAEFPAEPSGVTALAFSPDGRWLAVGGWNGTFQLWEAAQGGPPGPQHQRP